MLLPCAVRLVRVYSYRVQAGGIACRVLTTFYILQLQFPCAPWLPVTSPELMWTAMTKSPMGLEGAQRRRECRASLQLGSPVSFASSRD